VGSDSFVTSTIAAIATGWSDPLPGGTASHWETVPLHGARTFTSKSNAHARRTKEGAARKRGALQPISVLPAQALTASNT
jgi:hypothetical protein